jgi:hypothetical protein
MDYNEREGRYVPLLYFLEVHYARKQVSIRTDKRAEGTFSRMYGTEERP